MSLSIQWLGRMGYEEAFALQEQLAAQCRQSGETLLLLEHDPVYTMGRTPDRSSLGDPSGLPHPVVQINRGGQATYHGPGQLVGYPILDLQAHGQDLHLYLRELEEVLIESLQSYEITAQRRPSLTGVWVGDRKIASIGVGVRHWISMHGFALNVCGDLSAFDHITPCGISGVEMTSIEKETGKAVTVEAVAKAVADIFRLRFSEPASIE